MARHQVPLRQDQVDFLYRSGLELGLEKALSFLIARHYQCSRSVHVQAVDYAGS